MHPLVFRYIEVFKSSSKEQSSLLTQVSRNQSAPFVGLGANFQGYPFGRGLGPNQFPNYSHDDYFGMQRVMRGRGSSMFGGNMQGRGNMIFCGFVRCELCISIRIAALHLSSKSVKLANFIIFH